MGLFDEVPKRGFLLLNPPDCQKQPVLINLYPLTMPIVTRDRRGKRARETSEDTNDPEASLEKETGDADVVGVSQICSVPYTKMNSRLLLRTRR